MKTKFSGILTLFLAFVVQITFAQEKAISGTVSDPNGLPLPGVNIIVKGTTNGTQTDFDGKYSITSATGEILSYSFMGYKTKTVTVGASTTIDVTLEEDLAQLDEVVVTALGISREKKSLGYASQEVDGEAVSKVKAQNFVNSLSGKVAGLNIKPSGTIGGSTNVVIRGNSSVAGNNQALFVVDGIPIDNGNSNSSTQQAGGGGYDYGNAASDINPDDIESINVLKGAAASALYGSRASNGVIMITTKKGKKQKGIGVTINSSVTVGTPDKETLPTYQKKYGAGYGAYYSSSDGYFDLVDVNGDGILDETVVFTEDASYGAEFDPDRLIYQWNSIYPGLDTYQQATPWVAAENDPNTVWTTSSTLINSVDLTGGNEKGTFRLGYTNMMQEGNLPNSSIKRNNISFNGSLNLTEKLTASTSFNFSKTDGKGRYGTGYDSKNPMQQFRQWFQMNVDLKEQKDAYFSTGENITWNSNSVSDTSPIYSDNFYWTRYENYETDTRNRYWGNVVLDYEITDWLSVLGRFTFDTYSELQEERIAVGSVDVSEYSRYNRNVSEYNYDLMLSFNKDLTEKINLSGIAGFNLRQNNTNSIYAVTNGGLNLAGLYALSNSVNSIEAPSEYDATKVVDGEYVQASLGYDNFAFIEGTYRTDRSSSLPIDNNRYDYWSATGSLIFSQLLEADWLSFGKLRGNYGKVGNDTDAYNVFNTYAIGTPFNGGIATNPSAKSNPDLLPEEQTNWEIGLEMQFFQKRFGFDVTYYDALNENQITSVPLSNSTGYTSALLNAGTISNKGWEVTLNVTPIRTENFTWDMNVNWSKNESLVEELTDGIDNLELASFQGGVSINATPGEAYGTIRGTDLTYNENGEPIVGTNGYYVRTSTSNNVIGDINADWKAGLYNSFTYKNFNLSFLIDMQKGGDVFSLDTWYGYATGLYDFTAGTNDLGNPVRNSVADGGGVILPGVQADGSVNTVRAEANTYANPWGYARAANSQHVYDAGYVKLREATFSYSLKDLDRLPFTGVTFSVIGRNLWIIDKSVPYSDPEAGLSSGNAQGYQSGAYPSIREVGASVKLQF
ncbi:SusC/RagA family TonB-linked outer membrane protein [Formosa algae]|uniref:TonB-linked SusC/RagA family outer membrane protein n=1 Tax=Formosa algae TaxID=225843 RepID=A0A9X0YHK7_9FLAO|nr:SusC/RagA family TonB-linked outer membrane protein [Formosa algae]MBP1839010.1 TonB-linked SusC/RagA family outer membrane protein [Formosa algae]MDQ0333787.1 TonB-linked SusC/RagA family outer membrane protein [Formosa algae]OEI78969.1 SusC/RagA family protein [Formosa algae]